MMKFHAKFILGLTILLAAWQNAAMAQEYTGDYDGRWVIDDPTQKFSSNAREYLVVDILPCGADFCGVSYSNGNCGRTLFRFLKSSAEKSLITAQGQWGKEKMKLQITNEEFGGKFKDQILIALGGKDFDITAREGNMEVFFASFHRIRDAHCKAQ